LVSNSRKKLELLFLFLFLFSSVNASNFTNSIEIVPYHTSAIAGVAEDRFLRINNNADGSYSDVLIGYNITNGSLSFSDSYLKSNINVRSYINMNEITFNSSGTYMLCAKIINYAYMNGNFTCDQDSCVENISDNSVCFDIGVADADLINCDFNISIIPEKEYFVNEKIEYEFDVGYNNENCSDLFYIEYQVYSGYDNNENFINDSTPIAGHHSYTPKTAETDKVYFIKATLISYANDTNLSNNVDLIPVIYLNNFTNYLNVSILDYGNYDDYYRRETNDVAVLVEGNINDDYLDVYIKKSTLYKSNKHHIELVENTPFSFIQFINLDYLCYADDVDIDYRDEKPYEDYINLSKYYLFSQDNDEIVNLTLYVENDEQEIIEEFILNLTEFCYLRYNNTIFEEINKNNPVFVDDYLEDINISVVDEDDDSISKFEVIVDYYDDVLLTNNLPVKLLIKSNKEYNLTFSVAGRPTTRKNHEMTFNKFKQCVDNDCDTVCSNDDECTFHINKSQEKIILMDIDTKSFRDYLKELDDSYSMFTLRLSYVKDNQKTVHKIDLDVLIPQKKIYSDLNFSVDDIIHEIPALNDTIVMFGNVLTDLNNSRKLEDSEFIDISSTLKNSYTSLSLSLISLLITCSEVYKKILIFS